MKNSAWYHTFWLKKVNQYPVKDDADTSWADMKTLLDEHLPANITPDKNYGTKSIGSTVVSLLGVVLSAAAMIGLVTFITVKKHPVKNKVKPKHSKNLIAQKAAQTPFAFRGSDSTKNGSAAAKTNIAVNNNNVPSAGNNSNANNPARVISKAPYPGKNITADTMLNLHESDTRGNALSLITSSPGTGTVFIGINNSIQPPTGANYLVTTWLIKTENAEGSSKITVNKPGKSRDIKIKSHKSPPGNSQFEFSAEAVLNASGAGTNALFGLWAGYPLTSKWQLNGGIRAEISRTLLGNIVHPSYSRPDTMFNVTDSRKLNIISVPINLEYKISNVISVHAGSQINFSVHQSQHINKVGNVPRYTDTLSHSQSIDSALRYNNINKVTVGITGGINFKLSRFTIEGLYQQNVTPYNVTTGLGNYKEFYHSFQVGIRYTFKKKRP